MVKKRVENYIKSCGLETEDVPKVIGAFVCSKYTTWAAAVALGCRYRPLRRIVLERSTLTASPWAQRQRVLLSEAWKRARSWGRLRRVTPAHRLAARSLSQQAAQRPPALAARVTDGVGVGSKAVLAASSEAGSCAARKAISTQRRRLGARCSEGKSRIGRRWKEAVAVLRGKYSNAKTLYSTFTAGWRCRAGRKLLQYKQFALRHNCLRASPPSHNQGKLYAWFSAKYWKYADKLETFARTSLVGRLLSSNFGMKPQVLALGMAEGTILFKFSSPVVLPLQLWLLVNFFKRRPATCDDGAVSGQVK